jgi:hypothetical protein
MLDHSSGGRRSPEPGSHQSCHGREFGLQSGASAVQGARAPGSSLVGSGGNIATRTRRGREWSRLDDWAPVAVQASDQSQKACRVGFSQNGMEAMGSLGGEMKHQMVEPAVQRDGASVGDQGPGSR